MISDVLKYKTKSSLKKLLYEICVAYSYIDYNDEGLKIIDVVNYEDSTLLDINEFEDTKECGLTVITNERSRIHISYKEILGFMAMKLFEMEDE